MSNGNMADTVTAFAPGSVANVAIGFDILGFSVDAVGDRVTLNRRAEPGVVIKSITGVVDDLPLEAAKNTAGQALLALAAFRGLDFGFEMRIQKGIPLASGLGGSAASAVAAVVAANAMLEEPLTRIELLKVAMEGEALASGSRHADNLAPCIYGGLVLIRDTATLDIIPLKTPPVYISIVHPQIEIKTSYAREILPKDVPLKSAVTQWANVAGLVTGFINSDYPLISRSLVDVIIEPVRSKLIPGFDEVKRSGKEAGALGGGISGSGPSLFMISENEAIAKEVEKSMQEIYAKLGIAFKTYVTTVNTCGASVI